MPKKIIILLAFILLSHDKALSINPVWKSIIFPGWGEHALEENKRSRLFSNIELSLWTACLGAYTYSHHSMLQYKSFAVEHAGVFSSGKDKKYWVDIGNYIDIENHNSEHLRWRYFDELYDESDGWYWDNVDNMKKFESMRIRSDYFSKTGEYIIGAIVLNHIISAIDTYYLVRLKNITFFPVINNGVNEISLRVSL